MENPVFETKDDPIFVTRPPKFHGKFALAGRYSNNVSNAVINHASKFHEVFGILPSVHCKNLVEDLKQMGTEVKICTDLSQANKVTRKWAGILSKKYGFKENLITQLDIVSSTIAVRILLETIIPAYERCENDFTDKLREGLRRVGGKTKYPSFITTSLGTPFVELWIDMFLRISLKPTSEQLSRKLGNPNFIAFIRYETTGQNEIILRNLQRSKFEEHKLSTVPYGVLEQFFLLVAGSTKCRAIFLPTTKMVFEYWKKYDEHNNTHHTQHLNHNIHNTELRIYDELGHRYGKPVQMLPASEFVQMLTGQCVPGWRIELKRMRN